MQLERPRWRDAEPQAEPEADSGEDVTEARIFTGRLWPPRVGEVGLQKAHAELQNCRIADNYSGRKQQQPDHTLTLDSGGDNYQASMGMASLPPSSFLPPPFRSKQPPPRAPRALVRNPKDAKTVDANTGFVQRFGGTRSLNQASSHESSLGLGSLSRQKKCSTTRPRASGSHASREDRLPAGHRLYPPPPV